MNPKPGFITTEFYVVVASYILSGMVFFNIVTQPVASSLLYPFAVILAIANVLVSVFYIHSRTDLKKTLADFEAIISEETPVVTPETTAPVKNTP